MAHLTLLRGSMGAGKTQTSLYLRDHMPETVFIEIDDIKLRNHGPGKCDPDIDFPEAGREARAAMDSGREAVVIEPLCDKEHIQSVLKGAGIDLHSPLVSFIWLNCTLSTAISRKEKSHSHSVIKDQHQRYCDRHCPSGELIIDTDSTSIVDVAKQVYQFMRERISSQPC